MLLETLQQPRFTRLQLFVALQKGGKFSFSQNGVIAILSQACDQPALTFYAAFTIGNPIRRRADEMSPGSHFHGAGNVIRSELVPGISSPPTTALVTYPIV